MFYRNIKYRTDEMQENNHTVVQTRNQPTWTGLKPCVRGFIQMRSSIRHKHLSSRSSVTLIPLKSGYVPVHRNCVTSTDKYSVTEHTLTWRECRRIKQENWGRRYDDLWQRLTEPQTAFQCFSARLCQDVCTTLIITHSHTVIRLWSSIWLNSTLWCSYTGIYWFLHL